MSWIPLHDRFCFHVRKGLWLQLDVDLRPAACVLLAAVSSAPTSSEEVGEKTASNHSVSFILAMMRCPFRLMTPSMVEPWQP